jgi:hypothetical protein
VKIWVSTEIQILVSTGSTSRPSLYTVPVIEYDEVRGAHLRCDLLRMFNLKKTDQSSEYRV